MEKPKNYWTRAYVANGSAILYLVYIISPVPPTILNFLVPVLVLIAFFAGILSIAQGIRFKDWSYVFFGILSLLILIVGLMIFNNHMSHASFA